MNVDISHDERIVVQAETPAEQEFLEYFYNAFSGDEPTPNEIQGMVDGIPDSADMMAWYTLDVKNYNQLDHDLAERRVFDPEEGLDEPGARALVVSGGGEA